MIVLFILMRPNKIKSKSKFWKAFLIHRFKKASDNQLDFQQILDYKVQISIKVTPFFFFYLFIFFIYKSFHSIKYLKISNINDEHVNNNTKQCEPIEIFFIGIHVFLLRIISHIHDFLFFFYSLIFQQIFPFSDLFDL